MSRKVHVDLADRSYDITVGRGVPVGRSVRRPAGLRAMIVSDAVVDPLYGRKCERKLDALGFEVSRAVVPAGEGTKDTKWLNYLYGRALAAGLDRSSVIVALGGGVVGDLSGFLAATYLRGIRYIQVPTTLLAMVDSSVGGKTGINLPQGKNLVGAFHQPIEVSADVDTLKTLSHSEYISGLAEVVKYGVVWDAKLFTLLEKNQPAILRRNKALLEDIIARCCAIKAEIVACDEREGGVRAILNFGHTLGHAIETAAGYGKVLHGKAVAYGMVYAAVLSYHAVGLPEGDLMRVLMLLNGLRLPPVCPMKKPRWSRIRKLMESDKKSIGSVPRLVLATRIGCASPGHAVSEGLMKSVYERMF